MQAMDVSADKGQEVKVEKKEKEKGGESGGSGLDQLLLFFARFPLSQLQPRGTTGTIRLWQSGSAVTVQQNERISRAFYKLVTEGFLSAPVLNAAGEFVGMADLLDLVSFTVQLFGGVETTAQMSESDWERAFASEKKFVEARVEDVMKKEIIETPLYASGSVLHAMELFGRTGLHSAPVLDERSNAVIGICTQSMIISLVSQAVQMLEPLKDKKIKEMHAMLCKEVFAIREDARAVDGFKVMADKGVRGIAVVDNQGRIVDSLSVRDLRGIGTNASRWRRLFDTTKVFKAKVRSDFPQQTPPQPLTVTENDTVERVIRLMDDGNIHRVFEVEDSEPGKPSKPVHVIAQADVIRFALKASGVTISAATAKEKTP